LQLAIDIATFEGRDLAEFFSLPYRPVRTYFTVQMTRQKKWAEDKSAHLFHASCRPVKLATRLGRPAFKRDEQCEFA
jgi:hypothetical protein